MGNRFAFALLLAGLWHPASAANGYTELTCSSDGEREHCPADTSAGVALAQSTGQASCLLGRTWGYDAQGIWVTEGCSATFVIGRADPESERTAPGDEAQAAAMPASGGQDTAEGFTFYTRFGAITAIRDSEIEVQDNGSRLRFEFSAGEDMRFFALGEWGVNLTRGGTDFNPGESTSGGFVVLDTVSNDVLGARLGYVGVDFGAAGSLALGKQWGVHYDIAGYTDGFNAFGAEASATFNAASDGGFMGTGRADGALIYRKSLFDFLEIGAQLQMRELDNDEFLDGYGLSLRARVTPRLEAGIGYTRAHFDDSLRGQLLGLDGDGDYRIAGMKYTGETLTLGVVYAEQSNGDLVRIPVDDNGQITIVPEVFNANGVELFTRYQLGSFGLLAGFLEYEPDLESDNLLIDPDALRRYYIVGFDHLPVPRARLYAEYRLADGIDAQGVPGDDVFVLGAKYEFSASRSIN